MDKLEFEVMLSVCTADLAKYVLAQRPGISEDTVLELILTSQLYGFLEREETKVWHFSTPLLYDLLEMEEKTGKIDFPD